MRSRGPGALPPAPARGSRRARLFSEIMLAPRSRSVASVIPKLRRALSLYRPTVVSNASVQRRFSFVARPLSTAQFLCSSQQIRGFATKPSAPPSAEESVDDDSKALHNAIRSELKKEMQNESNPRALPNGWSTVTVDKFIGGDKSILFLSRKLQDEEICLITSTEVRFLLLRSVQYLPDYPLF
jgi:hypothetical protein